jgi:S-adenosylmethionine hydrolase
MAPAAAHLCRGFPVDQLGPPLPSLASLDWPGAEKVAHRITGRIESVDSFGNLISNITADMLAEAPTDDRVGVYCDEHETRGIFNAYADQPPLTLVALVGSDGRLELAIVNDSAALMLGVGVGTPVEVRW